MARRNKEEKDYGPHEPYTRTVFEYLKALDDLATLRDIAEGAGIKRWQVRQGLISLERVKAVDSVLDGGVLWWFATPSLDQRKKHPKVVRRPPMDLDPTAQAARRKGKTARPWVALEDKKVAGGVR